MLLNALSLVVVLFLSLLVAVKAKRKFELKFLPNNFKYLFEGNTTYWSITSNLGATFSLTLYVAGGILVGYYFGYIALLPLILAVMVTWWCFHYLGKKHPLFLQEKDTIITNYIGTQLGLAAQLFSVGLILIICVGFLSIELFLIREYLKEILFSGKNLGFLYTLLFMLICYHYSKNPTPEGPALV